MFRDVGVQESRQFGGREGCRLFRVEAVRGREGKGGRLALHHSPIHQAPQGAWKDLPGTKQSSGRQICSSSCSG